MARKLHQYDEEVSNRCPCCSLQEESIDHLFSCPHPESVKFRLERVEKLREWLRETKTDPDIISTVSAVLDRGYTTSFVKCVPVDADELVMEAAMEQDSLGFIQLQNGKKHSPVTALHVRHGKWYLLNGARILLHDYFDLNTVSGNFEMKYRQ